MKILAIDTSCDDTSVSISDEKNILSNVFWSKIKVHEKWGGVVPSEAKRQHEEFLDPAIEEALKVAGVDLSEIDYFAVTYGPGLGIALEPGVDKAKNLATKYNKPLIPVNHMVAHIYANLACDINGNKQSSTEEFEFPSLALTISGGHTDLYVLSDDLKFEHIGKTIDDAIGEAFDKVGRLLGLGFPAGSKIEKLAIDGDSNKYKLPRPLSDRDGFDWSFSGLKTAVLYEVYKLAGIYSGNQVKGSIKLEDLSSKITQENIADMAASFQSAAIDSLLIKVEKAIQKGRYKMLIIGGGVIANQYLRSSLEKLANKYSIKLVYPIPFWLCTDNAGMVAIAAYYYIKHGIMVSPSDLPLVDRKPSLSISGDHFLAKI